MSEPQETPARETSPSRSLKRLQFELALDLSVPTGRPMHETLAQAAEIAGVDLLFVLPSPTGQGMTGMVRITDDDGEEAFLQVRMADGGFVFADEDTMDQLMLRLARASIEVLQRVSADRAIREQLTAAA
jgi:hypothetical protein